MWRPNSKVAVYYRYSSRDRDQPESQLRKMQFSHIDLSHDSTPFDVHSKIVASKPTRTEEDFYEDPVKKLKEKTKPSD